ERSGPTPLRRARCRVGAPRRSAGRADRPLVVEQLAELRERDEGPRMLSPAEAGERLGRSAEWVRAHRTELGVVELGDGPRPRLGVPLERLAAYLCSTGRRTEQAENGSGKRSGRRRAQTSGAGSHASCPLGGGNRPDER